MITKIRTKLITLKSMLTLRTAPFKTGNRIYHLKNDVKIAFVIFEKKSKLHLSFKKIASII